MPNYQVELSTSARWYEENEGSWGPLITEQFRSWEDFTGIPVPDFEPDPNGYNVHVYCDDVVLDQLMNNTNYFVHWAEEIIEEEEIFQSESPVISAFWGLKQDGYTDRKAVAVLKEHFTKQDLQEAYLESLDSANATPDEVAALMLTEGRSKSATIEVLEDRFPHSVGNADDQTVYIVKAVIFASDDQLENVQDLLNHDVLAIIEGGTNDYYLIEFRAIVKDISKLSNLVDSYTETSRVSAEPSAQSTGKPKDGDVTANEWGMLRSWCARNGFSQAQIDEAIGTDYQGRKNSEVCDDLRNWIKEQYGVSL